MGGHINMMDDVLIGNLSPEYLRSALRTLLYTGTDMQKVFAQHVRTQLQQNEQATKPDSRALFPVNDEVSEECLSYLSTTRCFFASKLGLQSLDYIHHLTSAIPNANVTWTTSSPLAEILVKFDGDVVQAMQALKEVPNPNEQGMQQKLEAILTGFAECKDYCSQKQIEYPFERAARQVYDTLTLFFPATSKKLDSVASSQNLVIEQHANFETFRLGSQTVPRLFNGLWQLSSPAWGYSSANKQQEALLHLAKQGLTAADMSDHYGDAELVYGDFRASLPSESRGMVYAASKWCVFRDIGQPVTREYVLEAVQERCRRLRGRVDLLQFHWHNYEAKEYLDILVHLVAITKSHPELVSSIGLCNFDSKHTIEACEYLLEKTGEVGIVSNQVQFSVLDSRPLKHVTKACEKYNLKLLTYGSFCGGLLSEKWLGQSQPNPYSIENSLTPSQRKYLDTLMAWGTWEDFQGLLSTLADIATEQTSKLDKKITTATIAARWVLEQPAVGAILVGTRLGVSSHAEDNLAIFELKLDEGDMKAINDVVLGKSNERAEQIYTALGDCGDEYRH